MRVFPNRMNTYQKGIYYSGFHDNVCVVQLWLHVHCRSSEPSSVQSIELYASQALPDTDAFEGYSSSNPCGPQKTQCGCLQRNSAGLVVAGIPATQSRHLLARDEASKQKATTFFLGLLLSRPLLEYAAHCGLPYLNQSFQEETPWRVSHGWLQITLIEITQLTIKLPKNHFLVRKIDKQAETLKILIAIWRFFYIPFKQ